MSQTTLLSDPPVHYPSGDLELDLRWWAGAYAVALGRVDAIAFTGGIGEHSAQLRGAVVGDLTMLGVELDNEANERPTPPERRITTAQSRIAAYVIPTNEQLEIARACLHIVNLPS